MSETMRDGAGAHRTAAAWRDFVAHLGTVMRPKAPQVWAETLLRDFEHLERRLEQQEATRRALFTALCDITTALQDECERLRFSPHKLALEALRERLDVVIDQILDEGVEDDGC